MGFFDKIKQSLTRTKEQFVGRVDEIVRRADEPVRRSREVDGETADALEEALISADVGIAATDRIVPAGRGRPCPGGGRPDAREGGDQALLEAAQNPSA